ncbi:MAG: NAD(P)-dependent oxidoreductase, partial [Polynucleobacter sp.]|nr:NAD(P)-dependent oxidoreductase [Polynucleobacter sp.]
MKILLTGASGQLGRELKRSLASLGELIACDRSQLDLADAKALRAAVRDIAPTAIVNAAAYTAVDKAESEPQLADAINAEAPGALAAEARRLGALLIHYSTDYVFDGAKPTPYTEDDATAPLAAYGRSKLAGEAAITGSGARHLILRS